jgi:cytochrome c oxidase subunit 3
MYVAGGDSLDWKLGALNTLVLLISSFTMAQAVTETMQGQNKKALKYIYITVACALAFMVVKYFEYTGKIAHGLFPGVGMWNPDMNYIADSIRDKSLMENFSSENLRLFYVLYFCMTGLHGLHILIGVGLMIWIIKRLKNDEFSPKYYTSVEGVGLYWHVVDIIWIFLFPLMYLI